MTVLDAARSYVARGFAVTPTHGKAPFLDNWPNLRLTEADLEQHFSEGVNVGVLNGAPSGGLVDIDLDAPEALALAEVFLPSTGLVFGRTSRPRSHRQYVATPLVTTVQYKDVDDAKTTLVELRSSGTQTVWPGSRHPSGEAITFDTEEEIARVAGAELQTCVAQLAVCALLARHWPKMNGSRHEIALAAAGFLLRNDLDATLVEKIIANAARIAGDTEIDDRIAAIRTTAKKIKNNTRTTGGKTLADLLGDMVVGQLGRWLGLPAGDRPHAWTQPVPFRVYKLPDFPIEALPPWLKDYVAAEAEATQTPTDLPGMLVISVIATACAGKIVVVVDAEWTEPVNLYVVVVQEPGTRKSSVMSHLTTSLEEFEAVRLADARPRIAEGETRRKIAEQALQRAQQLAAKGPVAERTDAENLALRLARELDAIAIPVAPRLLADDCSPEKLATLMRDQGGPIAVMSPEGDLFDLMAGRYSASGVPNFGVYLKAHAGDPIRVDRVGRTSEFISRPALTLGLAVQPEVLRGLAARPGFRGRGLLARFLYALPRNLLGSRRVDPPSVPPSIRTSYQKNVQVLLTLTTGTNADGAPTAHLLKLSDAARLLLREFQARLERQLGEYGSLGCIADWAGKLAGAVVRIAGLLHMADNISTPSPWTKRIEREIMERAIRFAVYLVAHAKASFSEMGADPVVADAQHVLGWITRTNVTTFTRRDAFQGTKGRFKRVATLDPVLQVLMEHGYIRQRAPEERPGAGQKPSPMFEVNPALFKRDSESSGNSEKDRRGAGEPSPREDADSGVGEEEVYSESSSSSDVPEEGTPRSSQNSQNPQNSSRGTTEETAEWRA